MNNEIIKLFNRDGADLWLEKIKDLEPHISRWQLKVDDTHKYCLEYMRIIGDYPKEIEAIDPSGGPFISIGDVINSKYKIVDIVSATIFDIFEYGND